MPPEQDAVQIDQAVQTVWTQSIGQRCWLQYLVVVNDPHALPPWLAARRTGRVARIVPPPHDLVQPALNSVT